jgi:hypothetical protein
MQFNLEMSSETFWRFIFIIIMLGVVFLVYRTAPLIVVEHYQNCTCPKSVYDTSFYYNFVNHSTEGKSNTFSNICGNKTYHQVPCDCWKDGCLIDCFRCE